MGRRITVALLVFIMAVIIVFYHYGRSIWVPVYHEVVGRRTAAEAIAQYGPAVDSRLAPAFELVGVTYPPHKITLIGLKEEKLLEVWAEKSGKWVFVKNYEVKAASGRSGPKLREGDRQVPEGFYRVEGLNPNSRFHLSLKLNYPNEFDKRQASLDGRNKLGGDIFIHGKNASIGCLAMGDEAIEELFVLVSRVGVSNTTVIITPQDFRRRANVVDPGQPTWINQLYKSIEKELNRFVR